jgi:cytochrome P450
MKNLRSRVMASIAHRYVRRVAKRGLGLSALDHLPPAALVPLRRDGLDPVPELGRIRDEAPVHRLTTVFGLTVWIVTGHHQAKAVLNDAEAFSNDFANMIGGVPGAATTSPGGLGFADPPIHTRLRRILTPEFTMRRLARLEPRIHDIVVERLDAIAAKDEADLVADFALPIPSLVICELLGVPYADRDEFQRLAMARFDIFGGVTQSFGAISESLAYLRDVVRKQRLDPGDGLLGAIIREHGDDIGDDELAGLADGVLTGGFETTASMLALGALVLLEDPATRRLIHDDDAACAPFVEELLRHLSVVQVAFPRFARKDVEIDGVRIAKGDGVVVSLSGANRDPALGPDLETVDPARPATPHIAFGHGFHRCVGAELARMELRAAYPALVRRFPEMRLAVPAAELDFRRLSIVYGVERLPVRVNASVAARV